MNKIIFFLSFTVFSNNTFAALDTCGKVTPLTCSQGDLNDGTGIKKLPGFLDDKVKDQLSKVSKEAETKFLEKLSKKDIPPYELEVALSATGQGATEECSSYEKTKTVDDICKGLLAKGLSERVVSHLINPKLQVDRGELEDEIKLRESDLFSSVAEPIQKSISAELKLPESEKHLAEDIFPKVKERILKVVDKYIVDPKKNELIKNKVSAIRFGGLDCGKVEDAGLGPEFEANAFYTDQSNKFFFCKGFERYGRSDFAAVNIIAHEMGHSIDPCVIQKGGSIYGFSYSSKEKAAEEYPFPNLISCLRDKNSIWAKDLSKSSPGMADGPAPEPPRKKIKKFEKAKEPNVVGSDGDDLFCNTDQIGESFSDWLGTEVMSEFMNNEWKNLSERQVSNGLANIWRDACEPGVGLHNKSSPTDPHPPVRDRLERLIMVHPVVRKRLNCGPLPKDKIYCDLNTYSPKNSPMDPQAIPTEKDIPTQPNRVVNSIASKSQTEISTEIKIGEKITWLKFNDAKMTQVKFENSNGVSRTANIDEKDKKYILKKYRELASIKVEPACSTYIKISSNTEMTKYSCLTTGSTNAKKFAQFANVLSMASYPKKKNK